MRPQIDDARGDVQTTIFLTWPKSSIRRFPWRIRNYQFVIDRHHWVNHTSCSKSYNMNEYSELKNINSQVSEQRNRCLQKFAGRLSKMTFKNYMRSLYLIFGYINLNEKILFQIYSETKFHNFIINIFIFNILFLIITKI